MYLFNIFWVINSSKQDSNNKPGIMSKGRENGKGGRGKEGRRGERWWKEGIYIRGLRRVGGEGKEGKQATVVYGIYEKRGAPCTLYTLSYLPPPPSFSSLSCMALALVTHTPVCMCATTYIHTHTVSRIRIHVTHRTGFYNINLR